MSYLPQLGTVAVLILLACVSPGPDFVAVSSHGLANRSSGVMVALGVALGCVIWALVAAFGVDIIMKRVAYLYALIRTAGAVYLTYVGFMFLKAARNNVPPFQLGAKSASPLQSFQRGLLINLSNPKAAAFFGSVFIAILPRNAPIWVLSATVLIVGAIAFAWFSVLATIFSLNQVRTVYERIRRPVDGLTGAILITIGIGLAIFP